MRPLFAIPLPPPGEEPGVPRHAAPHLRPVSPSLSPSRPSPLRPMLPPFSTTPIRLPSPPGEEPGVPGHAAPHFSAGRADALHRRCRRLAAAQGAVQCGAVRCSVVRFSAVCWGAVQCGVTGLCGAGRGGPRPTVDFVLKAVGGSLAAIPGLEKQIDSTVASVLESVILWPERIVIKLNPAFDEKLLEMKYEGELVVTVVRAEGVKNVDTLGKSDPYTTIWLNPKHMAKTGVCKNNLNPSWNETFLLPVDDPHTAELTIKHVPSWNETFLLPVDDPHTAELTIKVEDDDVMQDSDLGWALFPLADLMDKSAPYQVTLDLLPHLHDDKLLGKDHKLGRITLLGLVWLHLLPATPAPPARRQAAGQGPQARPHYAAGERDMSGERGRRRVRDGDEERDSVTAAEKALLILKSVPLSSPLFPTLSPALSTQLAYRDYSDEERDSVTAAEKARGPRIKDHSVAAEQATAAMAAAAADSERRVREAAERALMTPRATMARRSSEVGQKSTKVVEQSQRRSSSDATDDALPVSVAPGAPAADAPAADAAATAADTAPAAAAAAAAAAPPVARAAPSLARSMGDLKHRDREGALQVSSDVEPTDSDTAAAGAEGDAPLSPLLSPGPDGKPKRRSGAMGFMSKVGQMGRNVKAGIEGGLSPK
ncbi:unnamed protein product [Closterium sp. NIES-53]